MITAMILACGMGVNDNQEYEYHCRSIASQIIVKTIEECTTELSEAIIIIEKNGWDVFGYECYNWSKGDKL